MGVLKMPVITFNAFSFLQKKLKEKGLPCSNVSMTINPNTSAEELIRIAGLDPEEVEAVFINGKVSLFDRILQDNDRVALIPPGTPGPYRVLLGFLNTKKK